MKIKVIAFGTFDLLHPGHLNYLQQAKKQGTHLTVVIARDKTKVKQNKPCLFKERERLKLIKSLALVDRAVLGNLSDHLKIIQKIKPEIICLGYDHRVRISQLRQKLKSLNLNPKIKRMKPYQPKKYKSSKFKKTMSCF